MTTRPRGEQLRLESSKTGSHILDDYLEAAEHGGRTLSDILADLFDTVTGQFRTDIFEFREDPANPGILQFRVGDFPDSTSGWFDLSFSDFTAFVAACQAAQLAAELAETNAEAARDLANTYKTEAANSAALADADRIAAQTARTGAETAEDGTNALYTAVQQTIAPPSATPPASPTGVGQLWYDQAENVVRAWDGSSWAPAVTASIGGMRFEGGTFGPTPSGVITVGGGFQFALVFQNGALLQEGTDYTQDGLAVTYLAPVAGEEYFIWAYQAIDSTDYFTKAESNDRFLHTGNDGAGSGFDADLLDGQQGSYYDTENALTGAGAVSAVLSSAAYIWRSSTSGTGLYKMTIGAFYDAIKAAIEAASNIFTGAFRVDHAEGAQVRSGIHGGYGDSVGSSSAFGASIWGMGASYNGSGLGSSFSPASMYGLAFLRAAHASANAGVGEGIYLYKAGTLSAAIGDAGGLIGGNKIWHAGNDGAGSGLDADTLDGMQPSAAATGDTIVQRHASGYIYGTYFNYSHAQTTRSADTHFFSGTSDGFIRANNKAGMKASLGFLEASDLNGFSTNIVVDAPGYAINGQSTNSTHGGVIGYTQNSSIYGILGHANAYSFYGNGKIQTSGHIETSSGSFYGSGAGLTGIPQAAVTGLVTALADKADNDISIIAGTGLDGGGTLGASRTLNVDATIWRDGNQPSAAQIAALYAGNGVGTVGTYAYCRQTSGVAKSPGSTIAGSSLIYISAGQDNSGISPGGSWRCMGYAPTGGDQSNTTLWERYA